MAISRRQLFERTGALGLGMVFAGTLDTVFGGPAHAAPPSGEVYGYGPLVPDPAKVLDLPEGFTYRLLSPTGSTFPGGVVPDRHDGMGLFPTAGGVLLVRNHELGTQTRAVPTPPALTFDPGAPGGTMTLEVDDDLQLVSQHASLGGTVRNCAGGRTPWGTWLSCEETEARAGDAGMTGKTLTKDHGWVFEVDPHDPSRNVDPQPLTAMGRYAHEAVAVDPETNVAYLTEDDDDPFGLFYRFTPADASGTHGSYRAGGVLEALRVPGVRDLSTVTRIHTRFPHVEWVPVPDPLAATTSTRRQLTDDQVTRSQKLEGAWYGRGAIYFAASFSRSDGTDGRRPHQGQVWRYEPKTGSLTLELIFDGGRFDGPDNISISPFGGGVVIAEDGGGPDQYLLGVARNGRPFPIARNRTPRNSELAGVVFSDDGRTLFGNIYTGTGGTFAIRGPWHTLSEADPHRP